jgi:hypothetical protein
MFANKVGGAAWLKTAVLLCHRLKYLTTSNISACRKIDNILLIKVSFISRKKEEARAGHFTVNEEHACRKTRQTSLQSIIPKYVVTSLLSLLTSSRRKIGVQMFYRILAK